MALSAMRASDWPKSLTWAEHPFTVAVRSAPHAGPSARLEFRVPPADCNPYLVMALMLGAGLDGIERALPAPDPVLSGGPDTVPAGARRFPRDLAEAADRLAGSAAARRIWGDAFTDHFAAACRAEYASLARAVSAEERARYLEA